MKNKKFWVKPPNVNNALEMIKSQQQSIDRWAMVKMLCGLSIETLLTARWFVKRIIYGSLESKDFFGFDSIKLSAVRCAIFDVIKV